MLIQRNLRMITIFKALHWLQRFKRSSFDLYYHLAARRGTGTSPEYFSSSGSPLSGGGRPTGDCPGEGECRPGGVVALSGELLPHHSETQPHLGGGGVSGVIWGCHCQEARQLQNCSPQPPRRCSWNALLEQFLQIGCQRCSQSGLDFHWSGCPLLQTGGGTGQAMRRRMRRRGRTSLGRRTTRRSLGRLGPRRRNGTRGGGVDWLEGVKENLCMETSTTHCGAGNKFEVSWVLGWDWKTFTHKWFDLILNKIFIDTHL